MKVVLNANMGNWSDVRYKHGETTDHHPDDFPDIGETVGEAVYDILGKASKAYVVVMTSDEHARIMDILSD